MSRLFAVLGAAVAVAGADKLMGDRGYTGMFQDLGWSRDSMRAVAATELAGGVLMGSRFTRKLGGTLVAAASFAVLVSELRHGNMSLAKPRAMVLLTAVAAAATPRRW